MRAAASILIAVFSLILMPISSGADEFSRAERDFLRHPSYEVFAEPTVFPFLRGYTDLTYWDYQSDHSLPLQFHSAQDGDNQFTNYFTALFVGSDISPEFSVLSQLHFHLNPIPGQVAPTLVVPQAKLTWKPLQGKHFRLHLGRFYSPFGITNDDVQTPLNTFVSQPYTGYTAIPFHWFDTGIQIDLALGITDNVGGNLVVAYTNGPQRIVPDIPPNFNALDNNILIPPSAPGGALLKTSFSELGNNIALHAGILPGIPGLQIGGSYTTGTLRDEPLLVPDPDVNLLPAGNRNMTGQFAADWDAVGVDLEYHWRRISLRGDWTRSTEELKGVNLLGAAPPDTTLKREAWRVQLAYQAMSNLRILIRDLFLTFRAEGRDPDMDVDNNADQRRYTFGINLLPHEQILFKFNYEMVEEIHGSDLDNDGVLFQGVVMF